MPDLVPIRRALISVSDKADLVAFARGLGDFDVEIVSTGATAAALADAGLEPIPVESVTGFPEMMGGRVKTLHPAIHGAVLARRDVDGDREALQEHGIHPIDLVCVNLYPFERTIRAKNVTPPEVIEQIDVGGPALVRAAAKNHRFVTVLTSPGQYEEVLGELRANRGATSIELRRRLAAAAFARTAAYDAAISGWMCPRPDEPLPLRRGTLKEVVGEAERAAIQATLRAHSWHISNAARELGLERSHLYKKMRLHGIERER